MSKKTVILHHFFILCEDQIHCCRSCEMVLNFHIVLKLSQTIYPSVFPWFPFVIYLYFLVENIVQNTVFMQLDFQRRLSLNYLQAARLDQYGILQFSKQS